MNIIRAPRDLETQGRPVALAIGVFDGVHRGHAEVIGRMVAAARKAGAISVVATFDRHPNAVVAPERTPPAIQSTSQRLRVFSALGAEATWLIRFDEAFSRQDGEQFVRSFVAGFGRVSTVCVGCTFRFGHRRLGDVDLLRRLGPELGFETEAVEPLELEGQTISSTRVRDLIREGELELAGRLLGRPYALAGRVVRGDQLGRKLGFPTANLEVAGLVLPPRGVYAARVAGPNGTQEAVMNIGVRPTVAGGESAVRVEVHLLGGAGELYGEELTVTPVVRLREEQRFAGLEALKAQIARDVEAARAALR